MKKLAFVLFCFIVGSLSAQTPVIKEITSRVDEVTVFLDGAQITRKKAVVLPKGTVLIKFTKLSPYIDGKSVQVKASGALTVLSVNHRKNFLQESEKSAALETFQGQLNQLDGDLTLTQTHLDIVREELSFLRDNRKVGGNNVSITVSQLQQASDFYGKKLTSLKMQEIDYNKKLRMLRSERAKVQRQINTLAGETETATGEIWVKAETKNAGSFPLEISYMVGNAGWFPSYDIRAKNISEPIELIYKANLKQDTRVDWQDVQLTFSSAEPNVSGVAPELQTYYLNYNTLPPAYKKQIGNISGKMMDEEGQPLPGGQVLVEGTTIGTSTDMDGNFSLTLPPQAGHVTFSYIGYVSQTLSVTRQVMNVFMQPAAMALDEVVVTAYGSRKSRTGAVQEVADLEMAEEAEIQIRGTNSLAIPTQKIENQTAVNFRIEKPYTVASDNKRFSVDMAVYNLPATYRYYCVPKINNHVYLLADILNWEKYSLLEGEANVFFEDTYVGKTLLDVRYAADTLQLSLGRDKQVVVNRTKNKEFTSKQFIGSKKKEIRAWHIEVKNNKAQVIQLSLLDQVPVSTREEIEVEVLKTSGAKHNRESGQITWQLELKPGQTEDVELKYSVEYPKSRVLYIE